MLARLAVLPGDGIGPEVTAEAVRVLEAIAERFGHRFEFTWADVGGQAIDKCGIPLPEETLSVCAASDAILFGAIGGPQWDDTQAKVRPEQALLGLRKHFDLFANLRPVKLFAGLQNASPVKNDIVAGTDLIIIRELTGGLYFGRPSRRWESKSGQRAVDTLRYSETEIERVVRLAFEMAGKRRKLVTSVDKANVLSSSRLWREVAAKVAQDYPDVAYENMLVDACAMHLIRNPRHFDVIVTENMFGDILTDEASVLSGSMGMLPSASLGVSSMGASITDGMHRFGMYEPIHGSAPDIAGKGLANPIATILSAAMLLRYSIGLPEEADIVEGAVLATLNEGYRTADIAEEGRRQVTTAEMGSLIASRVIAG